MTLNNLYFAHRQNKNIHRDNCFFSYVCVRKIANMVRRLSLRLRLKVRLWKFKPTTIINSKHIIILKRINLYTLLLFAIR